MLDYKGIRHDIEELRQEGFTLESILKMVNMARSAFYYHLSRLKKQ